MSTELHVAAMSFWHSHAVADPAVQFTGAGVFGTVAQHPAIRLVTAWDDDPDRGAAGAARLGVPFEPSLEAVLSRTDIDGVVVMNETVNHLQLCRAAAEHGKHLYVNKVLAPTLAQAQQIVDACDDAGVVLVVMLSRLYEPWAQRIRASIQNGQLGSIISMRIWHAHGIAVRFSAADGQGYLPNDHGFWRGEQGGGGAYIDMCHPQYLAPYLLGEMPTSIFSRMNSASGRGDVEDNAVSLLDFPSGAYAILEEGWASAPVTTYVEVQGSNGTILFRDDRADPRHAFFAIRTGDDRNFTELPVETPTSSPLDDWIEHVRLGLRHDDNIRRALELSALNEAAYLSAERKEAVIPLLVDHTPPAAR